MVLLERLNIFIGLRSLLCAVAGKEYNFQPFQCVVTVLFGAGSIDFGHLVMMFERSPAPHVHVFNAALQSAQPLFICDVGLHS